MVLEAAGGRRTAHRQGVVMRQAVLCLALESGSWMGLTLQLTQHLVHLQTRQAHSRIIVGRCKSIKIHPPNDPTEGKGMKRYKEIWIKT